MRESIEAEYRVSRDGNKIVKCCLESEVRAIVKDYADLERKLKIAEEKGMWISVNDRLPEIGTECLCYRPHAEATHDKKYRIATFDGSKNRKPNGKYQGFACYCEVTHWMPLPKPPEALSAIREE